MKQDRTTCSNSQYLLCRAARVPVLIDNAAAAEQTAGRVQSLYVLKRYMSSNHRLESYHYVAYVAEQGGKGL
ncbi:hypothetical protein WJX79_003157 [Trebouxia sp. C0005]